MNKQEAIKEFAADFDHIPTSLITKAYNWEDGSAEQLELLAGGTPCCLNCGGESEEADPIGKPCEYCEDNQEGEYEFRATYAWPAAWGWMFHPKDDEDWIRDNPKLVAQAGFLVYDCDEAGILLGVDGAGYDFYEAHWAKLYDLRGLQWHDREE